MLFAACSCEKTCPISLKPCPGECVFADVLHSVSVGVVVFQLDHREVVFCNRCARDLLGEHGVELDFDTLSTLLLPAGVQATGLPAVSQPDAVRFGWRFVGYTVYCARSIAWVFMRDITEKLRLEAIAEAMETSNSIGTIFSAVRHELGNPINAVKAAVSVLRSRIDTVPREEIGSYLERMGSELGKVEELLRCLRSYSLYEDLDIRPVEFPRFLTDFLALVSSNLGCRGIRLIPDPGDERSVLADPRALQQVLFNVVGNAADAVQDVRDPTIRVLFQCQHALAAIRVEDNGPGIPQHLRRHLFEPFYTSKPTGTGLGLAISRKLLAKMSGTIFLESYGCRGTVATITLPCARSQGETLERAR